MTIPIWPVDDLPRKVLADQFQSAARGNRLITQMEVGPGKQRRRGPATRQVNCAIIVTANGRARFDRFYEEELNFGVRPFWIPDQHGDGLPLLTEAGVPILTEAGVPLIIESWWLVQLGATQPAMPASSPITFRILFDLLVMP